MNHSTLCSSPYIFGMHEDCPADVLRKGWALKMAELYHDGGEHSGLDFSKENERGLGSIARLQYSWGGAGTIPNAYNLAGYLERVRSCVNNSKFCHTWIPFNEPNHPNEWLNGFAIYPENAAIVFNQVYDVIHNVPGHEMDLVLLPPIAPWIVTDQLGDWISYYKTFIQHADRFDGFAWHTYSRGSDPKSIWSYTSMDAPWDMYYNGFRTIEDLADCVPLMLKHLPVFVTEINQGDREWDNRNIGWVNDAYSYIDEWNHTQDNMRIHAMIMYRWPHAGRDKWHINDKPGVQEDFIQAQEHCYTWDFDDVPPLPTSPIRVEATFKISVPGKDTITLSGVLEEVL